MAKITTVVINKNKVLYNKTHSIENKPILLKYLYYYLYATLILSNSYRTLEVTYNDDNIENYTLYKGDAYNLSNNLTVDLNSSSHLKFIFIYNEE